MINKTINGVVGTVLGTLTKPFFDWLDDRKLSDQEKMEYRILHEQFIKGLEAELMVGQLKVNQTEARHGSIFVAGWRPFIGWTGGIALAYQFILYPLMIWSWAYLQSQGIISPDIAHPPMLDTSALFAMITGMLGIGAMRSYDKVNKVDTKKI